MKNARIAILFIMSAFCSCQKVIKVNLNSAAPRYVVAGNVTDQPGPYTINITKTIDFSQDNTFPGVSGATVFITDSNNNITDTLTEGSAGNYLTHTLVGVPGHTYHLDIAVGGNIFVCSSTMPQPVLLDSVRTQKSSFGKNIDVVPYYKDPVATGNNYHLTLKVKDSVSTEIYIHNDDLINGNEVANTLFNNIDVKTGDSITVELQCTDHKVNQYYDNLQQTIQQNSATPANPQSNITGGALGYFSAHTVDRKTIVAQ